MNRSLLTIAFLALTFITSSCNKQYKCHCVYAQPEHPYQAYHTITAANETEAANTCNDMDEAGYDCSLE